jgi:hypothetical protein
MFLAKDKNERPVWHTALQKGNFEVLQKLWEWEEELLTQQELMKRNLAKHKY